jgi:hypothetical protein
VQRREGHIKREGGRKGWRKGRRRGRTEDFFL